jgi:hypothetical protein
MIPKYRDRIPDVQQAIINIFRRDLNESITSKIIKHSLICRQKDRPHDIKRILDRNGINAELSKCARLVAIIRTIYNHNRIEADSVLQKGRITPKFLAIEKSKREVMRKLFYQDKLSDVEFPLLPIWLSDELRNVIIDEHLPISETELKSKIIARLTLRIIESIRLLEKRSSIEDINLVASSIQQHCILEDQKESGLIHEYSELTSYSELLILAKRA